MSVYKQIKIEYSFSQPNNRNCNFEKQKWEQVISYGLCILELIKTSFKTLSLLKVSPNRKQAINSVRIFLEKAFLY
jgi:hypothetical protein